MGRRASTIAVATSLAVGLGIAGAQLPVPYVALGPGPVTDTLGKVDGKPLIEVTGRKTYPTTGRLDLTTVDVYPSLNLATALTYWFNGDVAVIPREVVYPPGQSDEEADKENLREMAESQDHAITAALRELDIPLTADVVVERVAAGQPAERAGLRAGDHLVAIDGDAVTSVLALRRFVTRHAVGESLRVTYRRAKASPVTVAVGTVRSDDDGPVRPTIGVTLREEDRRYPFTVKIGLKDVGGPSAGLMFALGIIDVLTPGNLTGGAHIAGTGEIDGEGNVGPIGGIQQKLIAARHAGATVFLTPSGNFSEARRATPRGLRLVRVATLTDALDALRQIAAK